MRPSCSRWVSSNSRQRLRRQPLPQTVGSAPVAQRLPASSVPSAAVPSLLMMAAGLALAELPIPANSARTAAARNLPEFPSTAATSAAGSRKTPPKPPASVLSAATPLITAISYKVIDNPYFSKMQFQINRDTINLETIERRSGLGINLFGSGFDPTLYSEYRQYRNECDELEELFRAGMQGMVLRGYAPVAQPVVQAPVQQAAPVQQPAPAPAGPKFCPNCGAPADGGKFCQSCGSKLA